MLWQLARIESKMQQRARGHVRTPAQHLPPHACNVVFAVSSFHSFPLRVLRHVCTQEGVEQSAQQGLGEEGQEAQEEGEQVRVSTVKKVSFDSMRHARFSIPSNFPYVLVSSRRRRRSTRMQMLREYWK